MELTMGSLEIFAFAMLAVTLAVILLPQRKSKQRYTKAEVPPMQRPDFPNRHGVKVGQIRCKELEQRPPEQEGNPFWKPSTPPIQYRVLAVRDGWVQYCNHHTGHTHSSRLVDFAREYPHVYRIYC